MSDEENPFASFEFEKPPAGEPPVADKKKKGRGKAKKEKAPKAEKPATPKKERKPRTVPKTRAATVPVALLRYLIGFKTEELSAFFDLRTTIEKLPKRSRGKIVEALWKTFV